MNPDYKDGWAAYRRGEPLDPKQRGQWRRGWEGARDREAEKAGRKWVTAMDPRTAHLAAGVPTDGFPYIEPPKSLGRFDCRGNYRLGLADDEDGA